MKSANIIWQSGQTNISPIPAWYALPKPLDTLESIAIIGGGIAGLACAYALCKRGLSVELFEAESAIATKASSNAEALLRPQLSPDHNLPDQFYTEGYFYTSQIIHSLINSGHIFEHNLNGLLHLASTPSSLKRFAKIAEKREFPSDVAIAVDPLRASELAGISLKNSGFFYPQAGTVNMQEFCQALLKACGDKLIIHTKQKISRLEYQATKWALYNDSDHMLIQAKTIIIANAAAAKELSHCQDYPISELPGQVSIVPSNSSSQSLKVPLAYEGYITPAKNGQHIIGSTYRRGREQDLSESSRDHQLVADYLARLAPQLNLDFAKAKAWVKARSITPDHLPMVGAIANKATFMQAYQKLADGNNRVVYPQAEYWPNLFVSIGHGSKGLSSSLLSAEVLACIMTGQTLPIVAKTYQAIHPSRFWLRELKRQTCCSSPC
ncbi:MAG: FAD-dependent 5-carboxymethylaminomethyl-2-thiouridine(34) oxidoreductase MnmC [Gammaproteobacteria bacterium]|nr:FAD-dependent 5-carboxymethylaminomethyl-2-thiouridine(34) oxidoreductase MnmC [Gammaproteobacteria bacterium]